MGPPIHHRAERGGRQASRKKPVIAARFVCIFSALVAASGVIVTAGGNDQSSHSAALSSDSRGYFRALHLTLSATQFVRSLSRPALQRLAFGSRVAIVPVLRTVDAELKIDPELVRVGSMLAASWSVQGAWQDLTIDTHRAGAAQSRPLPAET